MPPLLSSSRRSDPSSPSSPSSSTTAFSTTSSTGGRPTLKKEKSRGALLVVSFRRGGSTLKKQSSKIFRRNKELDGKPLPHWDPELFVEVREGDDDDGGEDPTESVGPAAAGETAAGETAAGGSADNKKEDGAVQWRPKDGEHFWMENLTKNQRFVLRSGGTERPRTSALNMHFPEHGHYACRGCGQPTFDAQFKFESWTGWPAFGAYVRGSLATKVDDSLGWKRTAVACSRCGCHLGHVFKERNGDFGERHCVNGSAVKYVKAALERGEDGSCTVFGGRLR